MTDIKWQDPPRNAAGRPGAPGKWASIADALRERPGEWALVAENAPASTAANIRRGTYVGLGPAGSFEAVSRNTKRDRRADIYARFVGESA